MRRIQSTFTALALLVTLAGCGKSKDAARTELAQMNIAYTDKTFIETAREGNAAAVVYRCRHEP
jgi:predicted component of type VI protein secretion system